ncbi:hypothetical protein EDB19DRAFT_1646587 [Suillus lakei]|nr:hypothetical protein EDB19DRAFT_1646587 [Suillus lakei]
MNHSIPGKSSTAVVFEWQPDNEFGSFCQHIHLTKAEIPMTWMSYSKSTRVYDLFHNKWDLCDVLDPTSIPDGNWEEDNFPPAPEPIPVPPPSPPPLSSFLKDIEVYFSHYEVAPSMQYTRSVERFVSILHFHLGYHLAASTTTPRGRLTTFDDWTCKIQWTHLCKLIDDNPTNITSIPDAQNHVITCLIGYLVTLPQSQLADIPPDLWDSGLPCPCQSRTHTFEFHMYNNPSSSSTSSGHSRQIWCPGNWQLVFADYIVYEQHHHEFMNQPHTRVALLHGGLIWRLALHSLGFDVLPSVLDSISWEAVLFGLMLDVNGQTYFDDELSEEEVDFMCGTYYVHTSKFFLFTSTDALMFG